MIPRIGLVGIGTTSAPEKITVNGGGLISNNTGAGGNPSLLVRAHPSIDAAEVTVTSNHPLILGTNATERMRINATGNVGIGTTTASTTLQVNETVTASAVSIGHEQVSTTCSNVGANYDCNASCTGSKHLLGGFCSCSSTYITFNQTGDSGGFNCITGAACAGNVVATAICANVK